MAKQVKQTKAGLIGEMNAKIYKLYSSALKLVPNSPRQKKIVEEIDTLTKLRDKLKTSK